MLLRAGKATQWSSSAWAPQGQAGVLQTLTDDSTTATVFVMKQCLLHFTMMESSHVRGRAYHFRQQSLLVHVLSHDLLAHGAA